MKYISILFIFASFLHAFSFDIPVTISVNESTPFEQKESRTVTLNEAQQFGVGALYVVGAAGVVYATGSIYYNNCWTPKPFASVLLITSLYGSDPAGKATDRDLTILPCTMLPVIYYLGLQAENYKKDVTFSQSVSFGAKGFIFGYLLSNYLYPESKNESKEKDISFIYYPDLLGVSCKF